MDVPDSDGRVSGQLPERLRNAAVRRALTVPTVAIGAAALGCSAAVWAPIAAAFDVTQSGTRLPRLRLLSFGWAWTTLETLGVSAASGLWLIGRGGDRRAHYALQRWWAARLVDSLRIFANLRIEIDGLEHLTPGPIVMCARHASIADSLLPAWLLGRVGMRPRYVLKDELLLDPCLDIVGNRLPNHFVDRRPADSVRELDQIEQLARGMGADDAGVIFPEGMVVTEPRRARAVARITEHDPVRGARIGRLQRMAPVHPGGTRALLVGAPDADLVFVTHTGLEALRDLRDAADLPLTEPLRIRIRRVARRNVPTGDDFADWLDDEWERADRELVD